jgi:hypothetical protein
MPKTTVPSEEAIDAMALALKASGAIVLADHGSTYQAIPPHALRALLATALVAGAEHLPGPVSDGIDGQWMSDRLDRIEELFRAVTATSTSSAVDVRVDAAYQRGVNAERDVWEKRITQSARPLSGTVIHGKGCTEEYGCGDECKPAPGGLRGLLTHFGIDVEGKTITAADEPIDSAGRTRTETARTEAYAEGYRHGVNVGRAEGPPETFTLVGASGPTDYEMWRDAWSLSVANSRREASPNVLRENAEWFLDRLKAGPPGPPVPDCPHCGADSSMDHDEGCPNAPDPDNEPMDCVRCGAPPDGHPDGCPTMSIRCPHCGADPTTPIPETHDAGCPNEPNGE